MEMIQQLYKDTSGATMVEYALMIAFITLVCFTTIGTLGTNLQQTFTNASGGFGS
jgi:Flp pilus assembly pilin Flp